MILLFVFMSYIGNDIVLDRVVYEDTVLVVTQSGTPDDHVVVGPATLIPLPPYIL